MLFFLPAFRCGRRRENFFPSSSLVAGAGEFEKLLCCRPHSRPTWNNTTCVGHNLSYRLKRTRKLNGSLCVSNLLIHNLSHFPSVSLILAEPLSVVVQHHFHSYAHTHTLASESEPENGKIFIHVSAQGMFFHRGGEDEKQTFSPIPNDEWHFRFINEMQRLWWIRLSDSCRGVCNHLLIIYYTERVKVRIE